MGPEVEVEEKVFYCPLMQAISGRKEGRLAKLSTLIFLLTMHDLVERVQEGERAKNSA